MKKFLKAFSIVILVLTILIISKNEQKKSYAYVNRLVEKGNFEVIHEKNSIKFLSNKKYYKLSGDACEKKEYKIKLLDKIDLNENYLCVVGEIADEQSFNGSKEVEIEFKNLNYGYLNVKVNEKDKNGDIKSEENYAISLGFNIINLEYKYNCDYEIVVSDNNNMYEKLDIIDNLKTSELNSTETIKRVINLKSMMSLEQDLDLIQISDKIKNNSNIRYDTSYINYSLISPQTVIYKENQDEKKITLSTKSNYYFADSYSFDKNTGTFTLNSPQTFEIRNTSPIGKYTYLSTYSGSGNYTYIYKIISGPDENGKYDVTYMSGIEDSDDSGLYSYNTSNGITYFYRGVVENNYVKFGGYIWRIIRINEDGTLRLILDGDIGSVKWNDSSKYMYYTGYTFGDITYYPLIANSEKTTRQYMDSNEYCYSDFYTYDKSQNKYKLSGDIFCEKITYDNYNKKFKNLYTLNQTSRNATSYKMYKLSSASDYKTYYAYEYDTTSMSKLSYINSYEYCYGSDYEIDKGYYKLTGTIKCGLKINSSNYKSYQNYYTLAKNNKDSTNAIMYKFMDCPNCKSGAWNRNDSYNYRTYLTPVLNYSNSNSNFSNPKKLLDSWYNDNLSSYDSYILTSTFCNDTRDIFTVDGTSRRLSSPSFDCTGPFKFGGKYRNKIGLITADEMIFAGASNKKINNKYYLAYYKPYWTMTPAGNYSMFASTIREYDYNTENINAFGIEQIDAAKALYAQLYVGDSSLAVRPVINISGYNYIYNMNAGTKGNPYEIITDNKIIMAYISK